MGTGGPRRVERRGAGRERRVRAPRAAARMMARRSPLAPVRLASMVARQPWPARAARRLAAMPGAAATARFAWLPLALLWRHNRKKAPRFDLRLTHLIEVLVRGDALRRSPVRKAR